MRIRQPAVAGTFYPESADTLRSLIIDLLNDAPRRKLSPKVLVVPHADYEHSGAVAASAYCLLEEVRQKIRRVVLLGPPHETSFEGVALPDCSSYSSPLGDIPLDTQTMQSLLKFHQVHQSDNFHAVEHSLEVQCPFLQVCLDDFLLIPLVVGDISAMSVAEILDYLWGGEETLLIISTELSHWHSYEETTYRDTLTAKTIEQLSGGLTGGQANGCDLLNGMMTVAGRRGMGVTTLDIRNSGDTTGEQDRVVGYGAFVIQ